MLCASRKPFRLCDLLLPIQAGQWVSQPIERQVNLCTDLPLQLGSHTTLTNLEHKCDRLPGLSTSKCSASVLASDSDLGLGVQHCRVAWGHPHPRPGICAGRGCGIVYLATVTLGMKKPCNSVSRYVLCGTPMGTTSPKRCTSWITALV